MTTRPNADSAGPFRIAESADEAGVRAYLPVTWSRRRHEIIESLTQSVPLGLAELALPNHRDSIAELSHRSNFPGISFPVCSDLLVPPRPIRLRQLAPPMPVPEAAVDEHAPAVDLVRHIWPARQIVWTNPKACALRVKQPT
jgi:hypothetical protein